MVKFLQSIATAYRNGWGLSWLSNKTIPEVSLYIFTLLLPFILITQSGICYVLYSYFFLTHLLILKDKGLYKKRHTLNVKRIFAILVVFQFLGHVFMILIRFFNDVYQEIPITTWVLLYIGILLYLLIIIIATLTILNLAFYILLKFLFPFEIKSSLQPHNIPIKELSRYMTINDQIAYFVVAIFNGTLIGVTIIFGVEYLSRYLNKRSVDESNGISFFQFMNDEWFSLGTIIGILSVIIALLSVSIPIQNKIYNSAYEKHSNDLGEN